MGRHAKTVSDGNGADRRKSGYYATPQFVAEFLASRMMVLKPEGRTVMDPCVGKEELLRPFHRAGKTIDSYDVVDFGVHDLAAFTRRDFLQFYQEQKNSQILTADCRLPYDYYVANPPYNCHEVDYIRANKLMLQRLFPEVGVGNMYSMFVSAMVDLAKDGALIGLVTFDSFLTSHSHAALRNQILDSCTIHYLLLCPNDLFRSQGADVRTCILILEKGKRRIEGVRILNRPADSAQFRRQLETNHFAIQSLESILLLPPKDFNELVIGCPVSIKRLFGCPRLGEAFRCVTGISTGNDKLYISDTKTVTHDVPFYKNPGSRRFYTEPDGFLVRDFLDVEKTVKNFMVRNKDLLFRHGITCSSMGVPFGACFLPSNSTIGVNANVFPDDRDLWWLLAYLNSSLVTYFVRGVLLRTNMITSGYVSRIPIVPFSDSDKHRMGLVARKAFEEKAAPSQNQQYIDEIDEIVLRSLDLPNSDAAMIRSFAQNLLIST